jgi:hypothetical protein
MVMFMFDHPILLGSIRTCGLMLDLRKLYGNWLVFGVSIGSKNFDGYI